MRVVTKWRKRQKFSANVLCQKPQKNITKLFVKHRQNFTNCTIVYQQTLFVQNIRARDSVVRGNIQRLPSKAVQNAIRQNDTRRDNRKTHHSSKAFVGAK